jgi:HD-GYP domain-containing protein (c-di-GMP phosphodiesterase class II)
VAIADAYDAMTQDRPYKRSMSHDQAISELRRHAGTQFDPELVALFCSLYASRAPQPDPRLVAQVPAAVAEAATGLPSAPDPVVRRRRARTRSSDELATG